MTRPRTRVDRWRDAEYVSLTVAAEVIGISTAHIYRLAPTGTLPITVITSGPRREQRVVLVKDLVAYLEARDAERDTGQMFLFGEPAVAHAAAHAEAISTAVMVEVSGGSPWDTQVATDGAAAVRLALYAARATS